jgi:tetratricopeptide (TPR) repeat protein
MRFDQRVLKKRSCADAIRIRIHRNLNWSRQRAMKQKYQKYLPLAYLLVFILISCSNKAERIANARKYIKVWNYDRALTEIISYRSTKDSEIQYLLGYCYLKKNEFDEAMIYFEKSLTANEIYKDSIISIYNSLAKNALKINEPERALFFYEEIAKLVPTYEQASNLFLIGDLHYDSGNYPASIQAYIKALAIDSTSKQARRIKQRLVQALFETNKLYEALELAQVQYENLKTAANLLQLNEIRFALGNNLFNNGLLDSAEVFFDMIISMNEPKSLLDDAYFLLGEIYLKRNNFDKALEAYKKVLRLNPYEKGEVVKKAKERIKEIKEKT